MITPKHLFALDVSDKICEIGTCKYPSQLFTLTDNAGFTHYKIRMGTHGLCIQLNGSPYCCFLYLLEPS